MGSLHKETVACMAIKKQYGFRVFVGSCIFTTLTIALVLWDERTQRERRQEGVKYRLKSIQQKENMADYELQKQRLEEYKAARARMLLNAQLQGKTVIAFSTRALSSKAPVKKSNWKKDVVYLYQFPRSPAVPNLSPFCMKIETFLRAHQLKYEAIGSMSHRSSRGLLPFIELNGREIADSQLILWALQKEFQLEEGVSTKEEKAMVRAVERMLDTSTFHPLQYEKGAVNAELLLARNVSGAPLPGFVTNLIAKRFRDTMVKRIGRSMGKLTEAEMREVLRRDVEALSGILGDKKFLFGDRITTADCSAFGQLAVTYFLPFQQSITDLVDEDYPNLAAYLNRIRCHYFPEWKPM